MRLILVLCAVFAAAVASPQGRIVGGQEAIPFQFVHLASVRNFDNEHLCGGFVTAARWVITVAHCVIERTISNTQVVVGTHSLSRGGFDYQLSRIIPHPNYNANTAANNIALLETIFEFDITPYVRPIPFGTATITEATTAVVAGWGHADDSGNLSDTLQWISQATLTNADCIARHTIATQDFITEEKICTDNVVGQGMCDGDAGNALIAGGTVIGIAAWGYGGCGSGIPDVYTRMSTHTAWLNGIINA